MFHGLYVALVTPFKPDGTLNTSKTKELVEFHAANEVDGLVVCGTTGEASCLDAGEREEMLESVIQAAGGKLKVVAGVGDRSTRQTMANVQAASETGADAVLVVTPFYNRPGQEGLFEHFATVAQASPIPIMLYNVPSRTGVDLDPAIVARLAPMPGIQAIKEAKADTDRLSDLVLRCPEIDVLSGHDPNLLPALSVGCCGIVSVVGNLVPGDVKALIRAYESGDMASATHLHQKLFPLCRAMAMDTNPTPVKAAMNLAGWDVGSLRLPMQPLSGTKREFMEGILRRYGMDVRRS
jgi:4-hydroxy-tetrahydrodipicolinate synthase